VGAFNTVGSVSTCPQCLEEVPINVQFKYGSVWQHHYRIGDILRWGGNDRGQRGEVSVVVDAVAEACPNCGFDGDWDFYVFVTDGRITSVTPADGSLDFVSNGCGYLVMDPPRDGGFGDQNR
jgi:hypothetical protein